MLLSIWLTILLVIPLLVATKQLRSPDEPETAAKPPPLSKVVQITLDNFNSLLQSHELVFINFYADWCVFSSRLMPIFEAAAVQVVDKLPPSASVLFGRVDCTQQPKLTGMCSITKYPTLRLYNRGYPLRQEYRGQRSVDALVAYVQVQFEGSIKTFNDMTDLDAINPKRRSVICFLDSPNEANGGVFKLLAERYRNDCDFYMRIGPKLNNVTYTQHMPTVLFRPDTERTHAAEEVFPGNFSSPIDLENWLHAKCVPLVREVDFDNVEEIIEQRLPLLVLFHMDDDVTSVKDFKAIVEMELSAWKECGNFTFATVNGMKFRHSIFHMGKTLQDLPLIAVDSLKFMYPYSRFADMYIPGHLKKFICDFNKTQTLPNQQMENSNEQENFSPTLLNSRPLSTFKELGPSKHRYTLVGHDEL